MKWSGENWWRPALPWLWDSCPISLTLSTGRVRRKCKVFRSREENKAKWLSICCVSDGRARRERKEWTVSLVSVSRRGLIRLFVTNTGIPSFLSCSPCERGRCSRRRDRKIDTTLGTTVKLPRKSHLQGNELEVDYLKKWPDRVVRLYRTAHICSYQQWRQENLLQLPYGGLGLVVGSLFRRFDVPCKPPWWSFPSRRGSGTSERRGTDRSPSCWSPLAFPLTQPSCRVRCT